MAQGNKHFFDQFAEDMAVDFENQMNNMAFVSLKTGTKLTFHGDMNKELFITQASFIAEFARMNPEDVPNDPQWKDLHSKAVELTKEATIEMIN